MKLLFRLDPRTTKPFLVWRKEWKHSAEALTTQEFSMLTNLCKRFHISLEEASVEAEA